MSQKDVGWLVCFPSGNFEFLYLQWVSTNRAKLVTIIESKADFIDNFSSQVVKLTRHTTKAQNMYMKELKANMKPLDIILQGDFVENFSYVVQVANILKCRKLLTVVHMLNQTLATRTILAMSSHF